MVTIKRSMLLIGVVSVSLGMPSAHALQKKSGTSDEIRINTSNNKITCIAQVPDQDKTRELFWNNKVITFIQSLYKQNILTQVENAIQGQVNHYVPGNMPGDLQEKYADGSFKITSDQLKKIAEMDKNYQPFFVTIINGTENSLYIKNNNYLPALTPYLVSKEEVFEAYPYFEQEHQKSKKRTLLITALGSLLTGLGYYTYARHNPKSAWGYPSILGIPGVLALAIAINRYFTKQRPLSSLLDHYESFLKQTAKVVSSDIEDDQEVVASESNSIEIPAQSVFTEVLFLDKKKLDANGGISQTLNLHYGEEVNASSSSQSSGNAASVTTTVSTN